LIQVERGQSAAMVARLQLADITRLLRRSENRSGEVRASTVWIFQDLAPRFVSRTTEWFRAAL
jgi:hypothetical protein